MGSCWLLPDPGKSWFAKHGENSSPKNPKQQTNITQHKTTKKENEHLSVVLPNYDRNEERKAGARAQESVCGS